MKKSKLKPLLLSAILFAPLAWAQDTKVPEPGAAPVMKTVELEWETVPNATSYEVRLTPVDRGSKPLIFKSPDNHLSDSVPVGMYKLQIRSRGEDVDSSWSPPIDFEVAIKETFPLYPEDKAVIDAKTMEKQNVEFKWTPVKKVKVYTLKVWGEDQPDKPWTFTGQSTTKTLQVPPGRVYHWDVSFQSADGVTYDQNPKTFTFTLQGTRLNKPEIDKAQLPTLLEWQPVPEAKAYKGKLYFKHMDETEWTLVSEATLTENEWRMQRLKPGAYKLEITAVSPRRLSSETTSKEFFIKPSRDSLALLMRTAIQESSAARTRNNRE